MKAWSLAVLLIAAVLAEKALARPGAAEDEEDQDFQEDGPAAAEEDGGAAHSGPAIIPKILTSPLILTIKPGDTVTLPCQVESATTVVWLNKTSTLAIDSRRLSFANDQRLTFYPNHTMEIRNVQKTDAGEYTCKLSESLKVHHQLNLFEAKENGAPVTRISFSLLVGAVVLLFTRS